MGTLKTTLKVESTDLFPTPVSFTTVTNNTISANLSGFTSITVATSDTALAVIPAGGAWFYFASPSTNTQNITLSLDGVGALGADVPFAIIKPGDVGLIPFGTANTIEANATTSAQVLNYYVGTR
jgi:hypothetical protein